MSEEHKKDEVEVTNGANHPVPVQPVTGQLPTVAVVPSLSDLNKTYEKVGPNGFFIVLAGVVIVAVIGFAWQSIRAGQEAAQKTQEQLYKQLIDQEKVSNGREDKLIERADKLNKDQADRWEKSRERAEALAADIRAMNTKLDIVSTKVEAIGLIMKLPK